MDSLQIRQKEFCRLTNLTRKALLLYEEKGLLQPVYIDPGNGYRYYGEDQIIKGSMLSFLRNFNVTLNEIESLLNKHLTLSELNIKNRLEKELIDISIKANHCIQALRISRDEKTFLNTKPFIKTYPRHSVITLDSYGNISDMKMSILKLEFFRRKSAISMIGPMFIFYYPDCYPRCLHYKICFPVGSYHVVHHPDIKWEQLENHKVAATRHIGSYENLSIAYKRLKHYCSSKKWQCNGVYIETYLIGGDTRHTDSSSFVTEVAAVIS